MKRLAILAVLVAVSAANAGCCTLCQRLWGGCNTCETYAVPVTTYAEPCMQCAPCAQPCDACAAPAAGTIVVPQTYAPTQVDPIPGPN